MGLKLILSCVTLLNSDQFLYGHVHNVDRLIQHMLEQYSLFNMAKRTYLLYIKHCYLTNCRPNKNGEGQ